MPSLRIAVKRVYETPADEDGAVVGQVHAVRLPTFPAIERGDLVPAERAEPREEGGLATERRHLRDRVHERELDDLFRGVVIVAHARSQLPCRLKR